VLKKLTTGRPELGKESETIKRIDSIPSGSNLWDVGANNNKIYNYKFESG
jgi:hypothetical protein